VSQTLTRSTRREALTEDFLKVPAFFRRDLLSLFSYRVAYITDWVNLIVQILLFYFLNRLIPSDKLPSYGGEPVSYLEYVAVALTLTAFVQASLGRLIAAIRNEQLMGTLEALLVMPMSPEMLQLGSVFYDLLYVPFRTVVFLSLVTLLFDVHFNTAGIVPAMLIFLVFTPFMWGLGVLSAAIVLTFKRGSGVVGIVGTVLTFTSGAYFPIKYLPGWLESLTRYNPITVAIEASREALLGNADWSVIWPTVFKLIPMAAISLAIGMGAFRWALQRERRRGTMGLY
jgi:ABC-2 type transport system permease protein